MNDVLKAEPRGSNRIPYLGKGLMGGGGGMEGWGMVGVEAGIL